MNPAQSPSHQSTSQEADYRTPSDLAATQQTQLFELVRRGREQVEPIALEHPDDLDAACRRATAFRSFGELIEAMRG
ncbi:MAG: hypothetical protein AAFV29_23370, partial [Myxococcota bacterium]